LDSVIDLGAVKERQRAAWSSGDYAVIGTTLQMVGEQLAEACDIHWDEAVLDVAAGNGNATLAAARRGARVTSTDYVESLLQHGAARAKAEGQSVTFEVADAERLPYDDGRFDAVLSTFGVMFAPDHARAAAEMLRVTRPGGRIGLASWTPEGFIGQMFKVLGQHVPPPAGVLPPPRWGTESHLRELFGEAVSIEAVERTFTFRYRSGAHFVEVFRTWYGPILKAFAALGEAGGPALEADLVALVDRFNESGSDRMLVPGTYLEAVITRSMADLSGE
jgi:SAM-dependent methyltransferase